MASAWCTRSFGAIVLLSFAEREPQERFSLQYRLFFADRVLQLDITVSDTGCLFRGTGCVLHLLYERALRSFRDNLFLRAMHARRSNVSGAVPLALTQACNAFIYI